MRVAGEDKGGRRAGGGGGGGDQRQKEGGGEREKQGRRDPDLHSIFRLQSRIRSKVTRTFLALSTLSACLAPTLTALSLLGMGASLRVQDGSELVCCRRHEGEEGAAEAGGRGG